MAGHPSACTSVRNTTVVNVKRQSWEASSVTAITEKNVIVVTNVLLRVSCSIEYVNLTTTSLCVRLGLWIRTAADDHRRTTSTRQDYADLTRVRDLKDQHRK